LSGLGEVHDDVALRDPDLDPLIGEDLFDRLRPARSPIDPALPEPDVSVNPRSNTL
jgi:hypothetical protein